MGLVPAGGPGCLLERRGSPSPRGMAAQSRFLKRDGQNPAYRPSGITSSLQAKRSNPDGAIQTEQLDCFVALLLAMTVKGFEWPGRKDRTIGDSPAGALT